MKIPIKINKKIVTLCILGGVAILVAIPYISAWISSSIQTANTPREVKSAYEEKKASFNTYLKYADSLVTSKLVTDKIGETKKSVCYIHVAGGGGWVVEGYSQICYLRVTSGYYTDLTKDAVLTGMQKSTLSPYAQDNAWLANFPKDCVLTDPSPVVVRYVNKLNPPSTLNRYEHLEHEECGRPSSVQGLYSIEVRSDETNLSVKSIETLNESLIDNNRNQVWLEADYMYFNQPIVCKLAIIPILGNCHLSRSQPVQ